MSEVAEKLEAAEGLERIALTFETWPETWTQGESFRGRTGKSCGISAATCCCVGGATDIAIRDCDAHLVAARALHGECEIMGWSGSFPAYHRFNDAPERTIGEVIALVRAAAARLRESKP
jgi:hypothetical protein